MPMAVVTGGHFRSNIWPAQRHRLSVVGVPVMFQPVLVAFTATRITRHFEVPVLRRLDFMRGVAIRADGAPLVPFGQQLPMHALIVSLLNPHMALAAGLGYVGRVDRRIAI